MHLPTVTEFVALPEVQAVIQSGDAPPAWKSYPERAVPSIRAALVNAKFRAAPRGRLCRRQPNCANTAITTMACKPKKM